MGPRWAAGDSIQLPAEPPSSDENHQFLLGLVILPGGLA